MVNITVVSENYFKYDNSDYAKSLRKIFGNYSEYSKKMNSIMDMQKNPIAESKEKYRLAKKEQYQLALLKLRKAEANWDEFKNSYHTNLSLIRKQGGSGMLSFTQRDEALKASGSGAADAMYAFNNAQFEADYAFSLYNDATNSGLNFLS